MGAPGRGPRVGSDPRRWQRSKSAELPWLEGAARKWQTSGHSELWRWMGGGECDAPSPFLRRHRERLLLLEVMCFGDGWVYLGGCASITLLPFLIMKMEVTGGQGVMAQAPSGMSEASIHRRGRDRRPPRMFAFAACVGVNLCHAGGGVVLMFRPVFPLSRLPCMFRAHTCHVAAPPSWLPGASLRRRASPGRCLWRSAVPESSA